MAREKRASEPTLVPQEHGGALRRGNLGNRGGTGRPPSAVRATCLAAFEETIGYAVELARDPKATPRDRLAAIQLVGKYSGLQNLKYDPQEGMRHEQEERDFSDMFSIRMR